LRSGANTAIFSFINTVYLAPLPYPEPDRLMSVWETAPKVKGTGASPAAYLAWRKDTALFSTVGAWYWDVVTLSGGPWPERVQVQRVAGDYFQALGVQPASAADFSRRTSAPALIARCWSARVCGEAGSA